MARIEKRPVKGHNHWYMEYTCTPAHKPCSDNCNLCVKRCPTGALAGPYATCGVTCASFLTNKAPDNGAFEKYVSRIGNWLYGCDVCQDVCPFNKGQWSEDKNFPGLQELSADLSPEKIVTMDYAYLREVFAPKFWYIEAKDLWKWKRNALSVMRNKGDIHVVILIRFRFVCNCQD
jgi:epoxyqueuosine reductase